ncbi:histidine kinase [Phormidium tenue FACHB-886]|nr:histidine kinase [Phormidium tenue FACHB-886]
MEALQPQFSSAEAPLQLVLFTDKRPDSDERIRQIRNRLEELEPSCAYELQVVDVSDQPHLAERFKLVATPSLIKIHPLPRQTLAGSNLVAQLESWLPRWQQSVEDYLAKQNPSDLKPEGNSGQIRSVMQTAELIRLADEVFRLQKEKEELQAQLQFKDNLIAMLAHDLRNPLTAVSMALETLEMGNSSKDEKVRSRLTPKTIAQLLRHARTQAKALDRMITDILQAARERGAEIRIQPQALDLGELCAEVLDRLHEQLQSKAQQVRTDIPSDLPKVHADPERIRQVFVNLLDNAIKYTPEEGTIQVSILHRTTQKIQVSICDNGLGIPFENQKRIFEDRFRLKRDEAKEGYGIGLALCRRVVHAHYGQIWVESEPDQGSCFHFTLPVYRVIPMA